mmetsp:Transcript_36446/g.117035  ORF Transcript_36446/g.117035 Transcript_36446/m.117035 type:complete len:383 (+) Transcript_36446:64-1212(+)|eukprot:scaffold28649_cov111-Isochrysis_galbana.AAC.5
MSEKTMRSGTWSGSSLCFSAASRMRSHAASKLVEPPQPACRTFCTRSFSEAHPDRSTQEGLLSKVRTRCRKAGAVSSDVSKPRPMAACIGRPSIDPETSTRGTSLPRSIRLLGRAIFIARTSHSPAEASLASATACSRTAAAAASACSTPSFIDAHCASISSISAVERPRSMSLDAISCGCSCLPLILPSSILFRSPCRAATRPSSCGWRLPVSTSLPSNGRPSSSFRKAFRFRNRHRDDTRPHSISAHRLAAINTSVVPRAALQRERSWRYFRRDDSTLAEPYIWIAITRPSRSLRSREPPSRGAHLPARERLGVRPSAVAALSSASSEASCSQKIETHASATALLAPRSIIKSMSFQYPNRGRSLRVARTAVSSSRRRRA